MVNGREFWVFQIENENKLEKVLLDLNSMNSFICILES